MKCNHCGKNVGRALQFFDRTPGAVIVAQDSSGMLAMWPASWGLEKREGCIDFCTAKFSRGNLDYEVSGHNVSLLSLVDCTDLYGDCPDIGEAWLVVPSGKDSYLWTHIDPDIDFSD